MKFSLATLSFECESSVHLEDIEDEFKREASLAKQALEATVQARRLIIAAKIPFTRPAGYFCELLKTNEHMNKINNKASEEKEAKKAAELARKQRMNRKYGKKIQIQREQEKQAQVSEDKKKLNTIRKRKRENKDEFDVEVEEEILEKKPKNTTGGKRQKTVSQKRQARNEQYGFGGKNRNDKRNDRESAGKDEFNTARNKAPFRGVKGGRKGKQQRPGKARRQQIRGRKNSKK